MKMKKALKKVTPYRPGKPVEEVKRELGLKTVYKLASNEVPFEPEYIRGAVMREITLLNRYPESGCFYLRRALARKMKVSEDQLVFGNGSDDIIVMALRAFLEKGEGLIVGSPSFLMYKIEGTIEEAAITSVPCRDFRYDLDAMADAVTKKTKMIIVANPDNPQGTYVTEKEVTRFLKKVPKNVLVFFDEAYAEFVEEKDYPRTPAMLKKRDNIVISRTFSKIYGLAGLRIGYAVTSPAVAGILNTVRDPFNVNRIAQVSACAALKEKKFLSAVRTCVNQGKEYIYRELDALGIEYVRSVTNFILVNFDDDVGKLNSFLLKKGVIIRTMEGWGLKKFFRVTVGLPGENKAFIRALKSYLRR